jgi:DHA1 family multidrug resistance protein-like MFS transporter
VLTSKAGIGQSSFSADFNSPGRLAADTNRSAWEMLWLAAPICILIIISLPETSADNILLRRAKRLRKLTGRANIMAQSEINQANMSAKEVTFNALIKPWEINFKDPAVVCIT